MDDKQKARLIQDRFNEVKRHRSTFEQHWNLCARYVLPRYLDSFSGSEQTEGQRKNQDVYDSTAIKGLEMFAATLDSLLTPRSQKWHKLRASDPALMKSVRVRQWFDYVTELLFRYRYAADANYAAASHETYLSLGAFGTGGYLINPHPSGRGFLYQAQHLGNIYLVEDHFGRVDQLYRRLRLTPRQAVLQFGYDNLPQDIQKRYDKGETQSRKDEYIHYIGPRGDHDSSKLDARGMKYESIYVSEHGPKIVQEGGYFSFPMPFSRYVTAPGETYGRSPAMTALAAIQTLNEEKKTTLKAGQRAVDPPLLAFDDGVIDTVSLMAGAVNSGGLNADGRELIKPMLTGNNFSVADALMALERKDINDIFLVSLYTVLTESPQMTATEVLQRIQEKGALLAPTMGRQQTELLGPTIEREIDILSRQGLLPDVPPELIEAKGEYEVEYDSPLARAQRAEEASGLFRYIEMAGMYAEMTGDPSMFDHLDPDKIAPELAWIMSVRADWMRDPDQIKGVRDNRSEQQQVQQAIEAAPAAAGVMKAMQG